MAYVYRHVRLDKNEPFYIGIGTNDNYKRAHEKFPSRRNSTWTRIVAKTEYIVEILFDDITDEEAKCKEIEFVALYGRKDLKTGTLANRTAGGDGIIDRVFTPEYRKKLSDANKGRDMKLLIERSAEIRRGKKQPAWVGYKISAALKGKPKSAEHNLNGSLAKRGSKNPMYGLRGTTCPNYKGEVQIFKDGILLATVEGIQAACDFVGGKGKTKVSAVLTGRRQTYHGHTFKRLVM